MEQLVVKGKQKFNEIEIPVVYGGFGANQKVMTDKAIGEIHNQKTTQVRETINNNRKRFKDDIDIINLKVIGKTDNNLLHQIGYNSFEIGRADNIYILSERGYGKLIKIMDSDLAWDIHDKLQEEYFAMREVVNSIDIKKGLALVKATEGTTQGERLEGTKEYGDIRAEEERTKLKPKVDYYDTVLKRPDLINTTDIAKDLGMSARILNQKLKDIGIQFKRNGVWKLYSKYQDRVPEYADYEINEYGQQLKWTEKGREWIIELLGDEVRPIAFGMTLDQERALRG